MEAKFLDIDMDNLRNKLIILNAKLIHPEVFMKRKTFDYSDNKLRKVGGWVRVRDEYDKITLSYKQLNDRTLHGTKETSVEVNDFEKTCQLLFDIGFINRKLKLYRKKFKRNEFTEKIEEKRKSWEMDLKELILGGLPKFEIVKNEILKKLKL